MLRGVLFILPASHLARAAPISAQAQHDLRDYVLKRSHPDEHAGASVPFPPPYADGYKCAPRPRPAPTNQRHAAVCAHLLVASSFCVRAPSVCTDSVYTDCYRGDTECPRGTFCQVEWRPNW